MKIHFFSCFSFWNKRYTCFARFFAVFFSFLSEYAIDALRHSGRTIFEWFYVRSSLCIRLSLCIQNSLVAFFLRKENFGKVVTFELRFLSHAVYWFEMIWCSCRILATFWWYCVNCNMLNYLVKIWIILLEYGCVCKWGWQPTKLIFLLDDIGSLSWYSELKCS